VDNLFLFREKLPAVLWWIQLLALKLNVNTHYWPTRLILYNNNIYAYKVSGNQGNKYQLLTNWPVRQWGNEFKRYVLWRQSRVTRRSSGMSYYSIIPHFVWSTKKNNTRLKPMIIAYKSRSETSYIQYTIERHGFTNCSSLCCFGGVRGVRSRSATKRRCSRKRSLHYQVRPYWYRSSSGFQKISQ